MIATDKLQRWPVIGRFVIGQFSFVLEYPNTTLTSAKLTTALFCSGEMWHSGQGWDGEEKLGDLSAFTQQCIDLGVTIIGGCCRVTPRHLSVMRQTIDNNTK